MLPKMSTDATVSDIFYWPDGYWCFKDAFHQQPRLTYTYRIIFAGTEEWLRLSSVPSTAPGEQTLLPSGVSKPQGLST